MHQTMLSKKTNPLLDYAFSKLSPEVFSHPVWLHFGPREGEYNQNLIDELTNLTQILQKDHPGDACQLMLVCAVCQNYSHQHQNALMTIQQVLALAKQFGLAQEMLWANWGACAICVQQGIYEQAIGYLGDLKDTLGKQKEWILVDYIDIVKQSLPYSNGDKLYRKKPDQSLDELLTLTFDWLQHWGCSELQKKTNGAIYTLPASQSRAKPNSAPSFFSFQHWKECWQNFKLTLKSRTILHHPQNNMTSTMSWFAFYRNIPPKQGIETIINEGSQPSVTSGPIAVKKGISRIAARSSQRTVPTSKPVSVDTTNIVTASVQMLGTFNMTVQELPLKIPSSRGLSLLKYLIFHHKQNIPREILMDVFWPDTEPENARNNLNVAMYRIRHILRPATELPLIQYQDGMYGIAPCAQIWLDVEEFERLATTGQRLETRRQWSDAISDYEAAISLYQGDFLEETSYEGWTALPREHLRMVYLETLDHLSQIYYQQKHYAMCISLCQRILTEDNCREDAHCMLMRCYNHMGQDHLALRQYQACLNALRSELDVTPTPATTQLFEQIRQHRHTS